MRCKNSRINFLFVTLFYCLYNICIGRASVFANQIVGGYGVPAIACAVSTYSKDCKDNSELLLNVTSLYSSGGLRPPQQSMIHTPYLLVMMICIRLGTAEAGDLRYL